MFKSTKKLRQYYEEQDLASESLFYLSEKDYKAIQKKAKKEARRSGKGVHRNESER